jgi:hypothetical protein
MTVLWNQEVIKVREFTAIKPDIEIKTKEKNMNTDGCGHNSGQKCHA